MKRASPDPFRPDIGGQAPIANQQATNIADTAQPNGGNAPGYALVRPIPPNTAPGFPPPPAVPPPFQLARSPQFMQGRPGIAPLPAVPPPFQPAWLPQFMQGGTGLAPRPPMPPSFPPGSPPQFMQARPGIASSLPMSVAPLPAGNGGMPLPAVAVPPPSVPGAGAQAKSIFEDEALMARVKAAVGIGPAAVYSASFALQGEEQIRFCIASVEYIWQKEGALLDQWRGLLNRFCRQVGMERLLAQEWTDQVPYLSVLAKLKLNELLAEALKTEAGKASLRKVSKYGNTPLHLAARYSNFEAAQLILSADDDEDTLRMKANHYGKLPIHEAAGHGANDIARLLLTRKGKEQRFTAQFDRKALPIHLAIMHAANAELVRTLLEEYAEEQVTAQLGPIKETALMAAIKVCSPETVKLLLNVRSALPQQLTMRDNKNRTALDYAKRVGTPEIVALIEAAMKDLPEASSSSTTSSGATTTSSTTTNSTTTTTTASGPASGADDGPVPLTPYPPTPMAGEWPEVEEEFEVPDF